MTSSPRKQKRKSVIDELTITDKMLVLLLLKLGATQSEIASALGVDQGTVSKHFRWNVSKLTLECIGSRKSDQ